MLRAGQGTRQRAPPRRKGLHVILAFRPAPLPRLQSNLESLVVCPEDKYQALAGWGTGALALLRLLAGPFPEVGFALTPSLPD